MKRLLIFSIVASAFFLSHLSAETETLYNFNFNSGFGPSSGVGIPVVSASFGGLSDSPLVFSLEGNPLPFAYDQMQLGIEDSPTYKQVFIDFDFTSIGLLGSDAQFVLLLDTPSVRKLIFDNAGAISLSPIDGIAIEKQIGTFSNQETFHLHVDIDLSSNIWSIFKNDILLDSANFNADSYIQDMRFSYGLRSSSDLPDDSGAAIDNLVVAAIPVPEPTCLTLVILSGFSILLLRKFIKLSYQDAAANP